MCVNTHAYTHVHTHTHTSQIISKWKLVQVIVYKFNTHAVITDKLELDSENYSSGKIVTGMTGEAVREGGGGGGGAEEFHSLDKISS